jgi:hypothetical protein
LITALLHLYLAFRFPNGPDPIFILNGLGYIGLVTLLYLPVPALDHLRPLVRWVLMGYTALTIALWVVMGAGSPLTDTPPNPIAYIDKLIELALLVLLWLDQQAAR